MSVYELTVSVNPLKLQYLSQARLVVYIAFARQR